MNRRVLSLQIGLLLAAASPALVVLPAAAQTSDNAQASKTEQQKQPQVLQTVVVTAERRSQNIQDVPVAVTAITAGEIMRRGITGVNNLDAAAPGLMLERNTNASSPTIALRGTFNNDPSLFVDSPVAIYVDGVYYGKTAGAVFDLIDLQRIEVLRGPQGTLYGRNAYAGAISFITHKPSGVFNGNAQISLGNFNSRVGKFALDLPAMGKLKASVGARIDKRDGWFKTTPGSAVSQMNNTNSKSAFVDLLLDATDNLSFNYRIDYHHHDQQPQFGQVIHSDIQQVFHIPGINAYPGRQELGGVDAPALDKIKMTGQAFTATWKLGDDNTLKYIYGHREMDQVQNLDLDGTALPFGVALLNGRYQMSSNELQWLGKAGSFDWVAGLYSFRDTGFINDPQSYFFGAAHFDLSYGFATDSKAVFGQVNYHPSDKWTLTMGVRHTSDKRTGYEHQMGGGVNIPAFAGETDDSATTPMASVSYKINPKVMVYGRYAEGFKGGGFNGQATSMAAASTPYGPEFKKSYEVGVKSTLFGGKLRLNGVLFYEKNTGLQQTVAFSGQGGSTGTNIVNVGDSHDQGIELEMAARFSSSFTLRANYAYTKVKYEKFWVLGQNVANNRTVAGAPRNTFNLIADATFARTSYGVWRGLLDYRFIDSFYPGAGWINPPPGAASSLDAYTPAGSNINAKLSLAGMNWGHGISGTVSLWVHNLTDHDHIDGKINFGPSFGGLILGYYNEPRTYGISVTATW